MKTNRLFALGLALALAGGACGDDSGGGGKTNSDGGPGPGNPDGGPGTNPDGGPITNPDGGPITNPDGGPIDQPGSGSATITAAGGSVTSTDGNLTLTFSRYAYRRPTKVEIAVASAPPAGAKGTVYELKPTTEPFSDQNNPVVTVTLKYTAADLGGGSPQDLKVGQFIGGKWVELKPGPDQGGALATKANPAKMTITAQIRGLAPVALLGGLCVECATTTCTALDAACSFVGPNGGEPQVGKCAPAPAGTSCFVCRPVSDDDNDGYTAADGDCAPNDPKINRGAPELCNGVDDNCNNHTDEGCTPCASDADCKTSDEWCTKGFCDTEGCNDCSPSTCFVGPQNAQVAGACVPYGANGTCSRCVEKCDLDGDGQCPTNTDPSQVDCKEGDPSVYRGAPEICGNNVDNNCDGQIDENCNTCTVDADCPADGLVCVGGACQTCPAACDPNACSYNGIPGTCEPFGKGCTRCIKPCDTDKDGFCGAEGQDCQEGNAAVNQGALELCGNGVDDNCNQHTDEGCTACKADAECPAFQEYCNALGACDICQQLTCDPATCVWPLNQAPTTPTLPGTCALSPKGCARCDPPAGSDADGDGYPAQAAVDAAKARVPSVDLLAGTVRIADCDDTTAARSPGAVEACGNMVDDNCNGKIDELCTTCDTSMMCGMATVCNNSR